MAVKNKTACFPVNGSLSLNFNLNVMVKRKYAAVSAINRNKKYGLQRALKPKISIVSTLTSPQYKVKDLTLLYL
jgi:hypothetical protein